MKMNTGAWIGLIGGGLGMAAGIAAVIATSDGSPSGLILTGVMLLVFGIVFGIIYKVFFGPMMNAKRLQKTGVPGTARIVEVRDTGVTINNNPQVKLVLEVKNSFGQKYNTTLRILVSRINPFAYQPGMEIPVLIDPKNEKNVVINEGGGQTSSSYSSSSAQPNEAALKAELEQLQKDNDAIALSGRPARAIIKKYTWLGAYVNGNNPYVELDMEVLPEGAASFSGKAKGVVAEASVPKYQPGCEIYVKYDLYDNSRVVIDHS